MLAALLKVSISGAVGSATEGSEKLWSSDTWTRKSLSKDWDAESDELKFWMRGSTSRIRQDLSSNTTPTTLNAP